MVERNIAGAQRDDGKASREATIRAVFSHHRRLSAKVRVFADFLADRFAPEPYWDALAKIINFSPRRCAHA